jgi:hypothetical protein
MCPVYKTARRVKARDGYSIAERPGGPYVRGEPNRRRDGNREAWRPAARAIAKLSPFRKSERRAE